MEVEFETVRLGHAVAGQGPVPVLRGNAAGLPARLLEQMLDQIDYGIACVDDSGHLLHANRAARESWPAMHPEQEPLRSAIQAAATRGIRRLVDVSVADARVTVAVIPLAEASCAEAQVLLLLGKRTVCEQLSSYWYGVARGLTAAEQSVLAEIAAGCSPRDIAERRSVSLATVRSHITSLRGKTGTGNLYALLREMAQLPPIRCMAMDSSLG